VGVVSGRYAERDLVRVLPVRPLEAGEYVAAATNVQLRYDIGSSTIYVGEAEKGAAAGDAVWTIKKVILDGSGNPTQQVWSGDRTAIWNDRTTESYS